MGKIFGKILKTAAIIFIVAGLGLFICVLAANGWNFKNLGADELIENTYEVN